MPIVPLTRAYASVRKLPIIDRVDPRIFRLTYQRDCMGCRYCADLCCSFGAQVDPPNVERLLAADGEVEAYVGVPRKFWITETKSDDPDVPGGAVHRTQVINGACVFLDRLGRGCKLHSYALKHERDVHVLKPVVCSLFPVMYDEGLLRPAYEINEQELICLGPGDTLYQGSRATLLYYFGSEFIGELDRLEAEAWVGAQSTA